jgi:hypothetical protein
MNNNITFSTDLAQLESLEIGTQILFKTNYEKNAIVLGKMYSGKNTEKMILSDGMDYLFDEISEYAVPTFGVEVEQYKDRYLDKDSPYEVIKVITACKAGFNIGNAMKYIARADKKGNRKADIKKCLDYLKFDLEKKIPNDFVHEVDNPFKPNEIAIAWGLDARLTETLNLIWYGNIQLAIECLSTS